MEGADVGSVHVVTDDPLDLFENSQRDEDSEGSQNHRSHMRSEADLCDSNFIHVGARREQVCCLSASSKSTTTWASPTQDHTSRENSILSKIIFALPKGPMEAEQHNILHT